MNRLSIATHISVSLALMTASLMLVANSLGLAPDPRAVRIEAREALAELICASAVRAADSGDLTEFGRLTTDLVSRHADLRSVGLRLEDGGLASATPGHEALWQDARRFVSTPSQISIPVLREGKSLAEIQITFNESAVDGIGAILGHPIVPLVAFCAAVGFFAYRLYMRRVLSYLDPTAVIPERVRVVLDSLVEGVLILDREERIVLMNRAASRLVGTGLQDAIGKRASSFGWIDHVTRSAPVPPPWLETLEDGALRAGCRLELPAADGVAARLNATCAPIAGNDGSCRGVIVTLADLTEVESQRGELESLVRSLARSREEITRQNAELQRLVSIDPLTECVNRRALFERAGQCRAHAARKSTAYCCIMIDIDHFKKVNDNHGHKTGDAVLREVGALLRMLARGEDIVGRYGGEEFCIVLPDTGTEGAAQFAERIRERIASKPLGGVIVTASLGVAESGRGAESIETLFDLADRALYRAKRSGRNRVESDAGEGLRAAA